MKKNTVGILAFQGDVVEHDRILRQLGCNVQTVRTVHELQLCDALIIPGGESTTISLFLQNSGLDKVIIERAKKGMPVWGTCAGAILMAKRVKGNIIPPHLGLIDMTVARNAYGTQAESFYAEISIPKLKITNLRAAFIRAPVIEQTGAGVKVLARLNEKIIMAQEGRLVATTFHPELRNDTRLHEYLISLI